MAALRLPPSPVEESGAARAFGWASAAVAAAAIAYYGESYLVPPAALALAAAGHVSSHRRRHLPRGRLRQLVLAGLVVAALAYLLLDSVLAAFGGQVPQATFALLLLAVTSFDLKTRRNLYSSIWIGLAVLYLAAVYAWDLPFGLFAAAWATCLAGFWAASHLRRLGVEGLSLPWRPAAAGLAGVLVLGALLFWIVPQPTAPTTGPLIVSLPSALSFRGELEAPALPLVQVGAGAAGAADRINLRYRGRLGDEVVMYVRTGAPAYWRGIVFDRYRGGSWTVSDYGHRDLPPYVEPRLLRAPPGPQQGSFVQVFRVVQPLPGVIYAAAPVQGLYFPAAAVREDAFGNWQAPAPLKPGQTYSVVSSVPDYSARTLEAANPDPPLEQAYYDYSALSARARALARTAVAGAGGSRYAQVVALTRYLATHYRYTLELGHVPPGQDPVDWFLFDARAGYCEQFATADALMLRSLGIPTRLATGYATGQYDPVLDQSVVRARDAHAWVEVYFGGHGWVPVDPSPGYVGMAATRFPDRWAASGLARLLPHLAIGGAPAAAGLGLAALAPAALALLLAAFLVARRLRLPVRRPRPQPGEAEVIRLYERLQRRLGRRRAPPETPREYAAGTGAGDLGALLREVTAAVEEGVYAGRWPTPERVRHLAQRLS